MNRAFFFQGKLICKISEEEEDRLSIAFITFLATFYLFDSDYIPNFQNRLTFLQMLLFGDVKVAEDMFKTYDQAVKNYKQFKTR